MILKIHLLFRSYSTISQLRINKDTMKAYFIMTDWSTASSSGSKVGVIKISEYFSAEILHDEIEEIQRKTGYKNPLRLAISEDVLYIVENSDGLQAESSTVYAINVNDYDLQPIINVPSTTKYISFLHAGEQELNLSNQKSSHACRLGVTLGDESCFCPSGLTLQQTESGIDCVEAEEIENSMDFESVETVLYGVSDNSKDIFVVGYKKDHQVSIGPIQILQNLDQIVYPRQIRYDPVDNCLYILTEFDGKLHLSH